MNPQLIQNAVNPHCKGNSPQMWVKVAQSKGNRTVKSYIWYLEKKLN